MTYTFKPNGNEALLLCTGKQDDAGRYRRETTVWIDRFNYDEVCYHILRADPFNRITQRHLYFTRNERREMIERNRCKELIGLDGYRGLLELSEVLFGAAKPPPWSAGFNYFGWRLSVSWITPGALTFTGRPFVRHTISRKGAEDFFRNRAHPHLTPQQLCLYHPAEMFFRAFEYTDGGGLVKAA